MHRRSFLVGAGASIAPLVSGCIGGDGGGAEESPTPTGPEAGDGQAAQERYPDYNWEALGDAEPVASDSVTLRNTSFNPLVAAVKPGTEVTFTNEDSFGHTVTIPKLGVDEQLNSGQSTTATFEKAGTYDYVCTVHPPDMLGRIEVTEDLPVGTPGASLTTTQTEDGGRGGYY